MAKRYDLLNDMIGDSAKKPDQTGESSPERTRDASDYHQHFKGAETVPVATRLGKADRERLERHAIATDRRIGDIVRQWLLERMDAEGLR